MTTKANMTVRADGNPTGSVMAVSYSVADRCFHTYILNSDNFIIFHLIWYRVAHRLKNTEYGRHGLDL